MAQDSGTVGRWSTADLHIDWWTDGTAARMPYGAIVEDGAVTWVKTEDGWVEL